MRFRLSDAKFIVLALGIVISFQLPATSEVPPIAEEAVMEIKRTPQSLYLSSEGAHQIVSEKTDVLFVDVRDPVEIALTGHPLQIDGIVPIMVHGHEYVEELGEYELVENDHFLDQMAELLTETGFGKDHRIIITCGSGWRSAKAARKLQAAGYTDVWHIVDGYEGEEKPGLNTHNAWQLAGLPWTTTADVWGSAWRLAIEGKS